MWIPLLLAAPTLCQQPAAPIAPRPAELPELRVEGDDVLVDRSCRIVIAPGTVVRDANGDGVLHVVADGVRIEFAPGSILRGAPADAPLDGLEGIGVRIVDARDVELVGAQVAGFRVGIRAERADGLLVEGADVSGNFAQRLRSTPQAEDSSDWLWPHQNDAGEWRQRYGAGIAIEGSSGVIVRRSRARRTQNGLILERCDAARVYDNDFSFLSGWGIALWRTSDSLVSRNALDFCVRGYSHGVYNRGQDSAGLLMFEQCSRNVIAENSITHGGDGIFGFAGKEALGDGPVPEGFDHLRAGCNDNLFLGNDLSYAPAHGLELTFSFGNVIRGNRIHGNAICGIWGGYARDTLIEDNEFVANGDAGYGLERGAVNCEHAQELWVRRNTFRENAVGVHLWWDPDEHLARLPWSQANGHATRANRILDNRFRADAIGIHLRAAEATTLAGNSFEKVGQELLAQESEVHAEVEPARHPWRTEPWIEVQGETRPVGARSALRGRHNIVLTEWGPWDHRGPLLRRVAIEGAAHRWELLGAPPEARLRLDGEGLELDRERDGNGILSLRVRAAESGVRPYTLIVDSAGQRMVGRGTLVDARWEVRVFPSPVDPREDLEAWRRGAEGPEVIVVERRGALSLQFGGGGLPLTAGEERPSPPRDHFGTLARTRLALPGGRWRVRVLSDDGVRVSADGRVVFEDWTWHAPRRGEGLLELDGPREVELVVEHFELDGHAVLEVDLEPYGGP